MADGRERTAEEREAARRERERQHAGDGVFNQPENDEFAAPEPRPPVDWAQTEPAAGPDHHEVAQQVQDEDEYDHEGYEDDLDGREAS